MDQPKSASPATLAARSRLSAALMRQNELATASAKNPALDDDYKRAVADVVAAETALHEVSQ
jgi:hypothetical protein